MRLQEKTRRISRVVAATRLALGAILCAGITSPGLAEPPVPDLADLTLEQLGNVVVTSVSRREERLIEAPASIFVINADDIRRSAAQTLPEALRLAPNLNVARTSAAGYVVSARGFSSGLGNKMLVLQDGRILYSPLYSGVFWDAQDVVLEDVERIEVISGPGTTLWGANAVNGVINIITRSAAQTQGAMVSLGAGDRSRINTLRYGTELGEHGSLRFYGRLTEHEGTSRQDGTALVDAAERAQAGFRGDWTIRQDAITVQGDAYRARIDQTTGGFRDLEGANLIGRWTRSFQDGSSLRVQGYYDRVERDQPGAVREKLDIADAEIHHALRPHGAHRVLWGGGYRNADSKTEEIPFAPAFLPRSRTLQSWHLFAHDEIALTPTVDLTLGLKVEHNSYTGAEVLPNARLAWRLSWERMVWLAATRAVRAPSRVDREFHSMGISPTTVRGGPEFQSEIAEVLEIGYRAQASPGFSYSLTVFHHWYDRLRSFEPLPGGGGLEIRNRMEGTAHGAEAWGTYRVSDDFRLSAGAVFQRMQLRLEPGSLSAGGVAVQGNDPDHWITMRASWDLSSRHELDVAVRHVGDLPDPAVPAYTAVDARLGWRVTRPLELSVSVKNAFDHSHPEFGPFPSRPEFARTIFFKALWRPGATR